MKFPVAIDPVCCLGHHRRILVGGSAAKGALGMDCCGHAGQAAKLLCCCAAVLLCCCAAVQLAWV